MGDIVLNRETGFCFFVSWIWYDADVSLFINKNNDIYTKFNNLILG